jgi:hypothetical protein
MTVVPQIDFFMGREVMDVGEDGDEWYIQFVGNARLYITDPNYEMPESEVLIDKSLTKQVLSGGVMTLYFGTPDNPTGTEVNISATEYEISDPNYNKGERVNPNVAMEQAAADLEFDQAPGERVVDGPETPPETTDDEG